MKVIVLKDNAGIEDKNKPIGRQARRGQIVELNPNTARNWLIPAGVVLPATEENVRRVRKAVAAEDQGNV